LIFSYLPWLPLTIGLVFPAVDKTIAIFF